MKRSHLCRNLKQTNKKRQPKPEKKRDEICGYWRQGLQGKKEVGQSYKPSVTREVSTKDVVNVTVTVVKTSRYV